MSLKVSKLKKVVYRPEQQEQEAVARYLTTAYPHVLYCASAGGLRTSLKSAVRMKKAGYKKGFPDLFIYKGMGVWHGLAIEMKKEKGGVTSPEQLAWGKNLSDNFYQYHICHGFDEAKKVIDHYLRGPQRGDQ